MGGWVSSCTDFTFTFTFTFTLPILSFLSMMEGFVLLVLLLVPLILWSFLLGTIFKKSPLIILQRKFPEKRQNFRRCGLGSVHYLPSEFHFVFLVVNTGTLVVTKRRRMRRERKKKSEEFQFTDMLIDRDLVSTTSSSHKNGSVSSSSSSSSSRGAVPKHAGRKASYYPG